MTHNEKKANRSLLRHFVFRKSSPKLSGWISRLPPSVKFNFWLLSVILFLFPLCLSCFWLISLGVPQEIAKSCFMIYGLASVTAMAGFRMEIPKNPNDYIVVFSLVAILSTVLGIIRYGTEVLLVSGAIYLLTIIPVFITSRLVKYS